MLCMKKKDNGCLHFSRICHGIYNALFYGHLHHDFDVYLQRDTELQASGWSLSTEKKNVRTTGRKIGTPE